MSCIYPSTRTRLRTCHQRTCRKHPHTMGFSDTHKHNTNVQTQPQSPQPTHSATTAGGLIHPGTPAALRRFLPSLSITPHWFWGPAAWQLFISCNYVWKRCLFLLSLSHNWVNILSLQHVDHRMVGDCSSTVLCINCAWCMEYRAGYIPSLEFTFSCRCVIQKALLHVLHMLRVLHVLRVLRVHQNVLICVWQKKK